MRRTDQKTYFQVVFCCTIGILAFLSQSAMAQPKSLEQRVVQAVRLQVRQDTWKMGQPGLWPKLLEGPLVSNLDWPLQISPREVFAWQEGQSGRQKWVRFDLAVGLAERLPKFRAEDVILWRDGGLSLGMESQLKYRHPEKPPFPLGTSGLALYGYEITWEPHQHRASLQTNLSTYPGDPRLLRLQGNISIALPLKKIAFTGKLLIGELQLGTITDAELSGEMVKGTLTLFDSKNPLAPPRAKAQFQLDHAGLSATGDFTFLKVFRKQLELSLTWDGKGSFQSSTELHLLGLKSQLAVQTSIGQGQLYFQARTVKGIHLGPLQHEIRLGFEGVAGKGKSGT